MASDVCVITAIYGDYDELKPAIEQEGVDAEWVLVTDRPREDALGWRVVVEPKPSAHRNMAAKEPKCCPWRYTKARYSIWIDGSFLVHSPHFAAELIKAVLEPAPPIAQYRHPLRDCLYREALACYDQPKYVALPILDQAGAYRAEGHPVGWGLWAGGIIARRHDPEVMVFGGLWLDQIDRWGFQDQISEPYCLRRCGLAPSTLPGGIFDGRFFSYHGSNRHSADVPQ